MKRILLLCLPVALCVGCATATFNPYQGNQMAWPVSAGAVANTEFGIPIYKAAPPQPYEILGEITNRNVNSVDEFSSIRAIANRAKEIGADALLLVEPQKFFDTAAAATAAKTATGSVRAGNWSTFMRGVGRNTVLLAIKWMPQVETVVETVTIGFSPYVGEQLEWPVAAGGIAPMDYGLPVYEQFPIKPYEILGEITATRPTSGSVIGVQQLIGPAQENGAEALLVIERKGFFTVSGAGKRPAGRTAMLNTFLQQGTGETGVLAIRWKKSGGE